MKRGNKIIGLFIISGIMLFSGCNKDNVNPPSILPESFNVDIPSSISTNNSSLRVTNTDTIKGNDIYSNLRTFIAVGKGSALLVQDVIIAIRANHIDKPMSLSFTSRDDSRVKNVVVVSNADFDNSTWEFQMTVTDAESESNPDGGKAIEVFWNRNPVKGIAVMKPYNMNRNNTWASDTVLVRVDYSEAGESGYDKQMIVTLTDLPLALPATNPYSMRALRMFVGKNGDNVDVYGNSSHPNAVFLSGQKGFDWAFVASVSASADIGVAEVGLPPSNLNATSRTVLLGDYSIKNVFTNEIKAVFPNIGQAQLDAFLYNTAAPGYFNSGGFIQGGTSPGSQYDSLTPRIEVLSPYNPVDILNLAVAFK